MKILCVGQMGWDITTIGENRYKNYGGSVLHFTLAAALMGLKVDMLCYVNKNEWKDLLIKLDGLGVGTDQIIDFYDTIKFYMYYDKNMNFCEDRFSMEISKNEPLIFEAIPKNIPYDMYNICETTPEQDSHTLEKIVNCNPNAKICMQYHIDNLFRNKELYLTMLGVIDYIFMNMDEALYISGKGSISDAIEYLQQKIKNVLFITSHHINYAVYSKGVITMNAMPVSGVIDPTGAGDCFAGGAVAGLCIDNQLEDALRFGAICSYFKLKGYSSNYLLDMLNVSR